MKMTSKKAIIISALKKAMRKGTLFPPIYGWEKTTVSSPMGTIAVESTVVFGSEYSLDGEFRATSGGVTVTGLWRSQDGRSDELFVG